MARKLLSGGKENIKPPTKKTLTAASEDLRKGHSLGGRVMSEKAVAVREGVAGKKGGPSKKGARNSAPPPPKKR